ncbi:hypothetical protein PULV_a0766 [Pseudoalteromonas ulvae UL12]|nr:hypothetical protein [Pseudoalteromonas ulvae UL12]
MDYLINFIHKNKLKTKLQAINLLQNMQLTGIACSFYFG